MSCFNLPLCRCLAFNCTLSAHISDTDGVPSTPQGFRPCLKKASCLLVVFHKLIRIPRLTFPFRSWVKNVTRRANEIEAEPVPQRPLYPTELKPALESAHAKKEPTSVLWRAGAWIYQKQNPSGPVQEQRTSKPFSSTGYNVCQPKLMPEESVLSGERMALADVAESIDEELK